ncbi:MAG: disulfide reductase, partial [Candidatus Lokiarchaeota archaeon]|nr:disulfide reductase [Candidatus Lokiarchaeota archaeon]
MATAGQRIGIFICHCGFNIGGVLDVKRIIDHFSSKEQYPDVVITDHKYFCSDAGLAEMKKAIKELGIERVIVAACTMKLH